MFDRFTNRAKDALVLARQEAHAPGGEFLGADHILVGLLSSDCGARRILERLGGEVAVMRTEILAMIEVFPSSPVSEPSPFQPEAMRILEHAMDEAGQGRDHYIGTEHLLAGILREPDSAAAKLVHRHGIRLPFVREQLAKLSGPEDEGPADARGPRPPR